MQVALRMVARGQQAKMHDVIPYIFCLPADGVSAKNAKAENAFHPDEVRRENRKIGALDIKLLTYEHTHV